MLKIDEKSMAALRRRNERRVRKVREKMGEKWLAHPSNRVQKRGGNG